MIYRHFTAPFAALIEAGEIRVHDTPRMSRKNNNLLVELRIPARSAASMVTALQDMTDEELAEHPGVDMRVRINQPVETTNPSVDVSGARVVDMRIATYSRMTREFVATAVTVVDNDGHATTLYTAPTKGR